MKIRWYGHACFLMESENETKVLIDPFDGSVGYEVPELTADIVTVSHDHYDHNYTEKVQGNPTIIKDAAQYEIQGIKIQGFPAFHDDVKGAERGPNIIYVFEMDGLRICHLGDLGHLLSNSQLEEIGPIDILMVPVGGTFTIDAKQAVAAIEQLEPKLAIPMHFKTPAISMPIDPVDKFLKTIGKGEVLDTTTIEVNKDILDDELKVIVLQYEEES